MNFLRNLFALIGLLCVVAIVVVAIQAMPYLGKARGFEDQSLTVYTEMAKTLLETGSAAQATVWKRKVDEGLSPEDVETSMKSIASSHNIKKVGELPLYKEVAAMSGKPYRFAKIYMFCNALTAAKMMDFDNAFSAYLPCRIALVQHPDGELWLYTLNMDMMIYGGKPLPAELKQTALEVKETILAIMEGGATGDF